MRWVSAAGDGRGATAQCAGFHDPIGSYVQQAHSADVQASTLPKAAVQQYSSHFLGLLALDMTAELRDTGRAATDIGLTAVTSTHARFSWRDVYVASLAETVTGTAGNSVTTKCTRTDESISFIRNCW